MIDTNNDNVNIEEVTDGTDAGTGLVVDHEGVAEATEVVTEAEEVTEAPGESGVEAGAEVMALSLPACEYEDSQNCIWDAQKSGNGEGNSFVDIDGTAHYYDYTGVYDDLDEQINCDSQQIVSTFMQKVVGFKENEDGSTTMVDLGNEFETFTDYFDMTTEELHEYCGIVPTVVDAELPELEPVPEVVIEAPVVVDSPEELAVTGGLDFLTPVLVGSVLLAAGAALIIRKTFKKA